MNRVLTKALGMVILVATVGLASCQALWVEAPTLPLTIEGQE